MKYFIHIALIITFFSCKTDINPSNAHKKVETELRAEINNLKTIIDSLNNTPDKQFLNGQNKLAAGKRKEALNQFEKIAKNYKGSEYENKSNKEINKIKTYLEKEKRKKELKKSLGFKILKPKSTIKLENLTLKFNSIRFKKSFIFDSYGSQYFYRDAERGSKHITAKVSITSKLKDPNFPHILVYILKNGGLQNITPLGLEYRFRRWDDYGTYLGNSADYHNDFSHTKTIPFSLGYEIEEQEYKGYPIYIVLYNKLNITRENKKYENPPVNYNPKSYGFKEELSVDDFDEGGDYILIKKM